MNVVLAFSGGKDSAWALWRLRQSPSHRVVALLTTATNNHIPLQNIPLSIIREQAALAGLPLVVVDLPERCPNEEYTARLTESLAGITRNYELDAVAFGDLFLEDIRAFREQTIAPTGLLCEFPLWNEDTMVLARAMINGGLRATLTAVNAELLRGVAPGTEFDGAFLERLGDGTDPCGENGEFHTVVTTGPMFSGSVVINSAGVYTASPYSYLKFAAGQR